MSSNTSGEPNFQNIIDYGQYQQRDVCPGCGRCRQCGRPYPAPVWIPAPFWSPPAPAYSGDSITIAPDPNVTVWANSSNLPAHAWSFTAEGHAPEQG